MSIRSYIENVRSKPEKDKRRAAFWWAFGATAIMAVFWVGSITGIDIKSGAAVASAVDRAGSPAQSMVAGAGALASDLWSIIAGPKKLTYSEVQVVPGTR
ncbi:MAG: hypothetical protein KGI69_01885 [Patescibacteria group bacterium]|nr:hypothetical protein [Patescibacteria group bacterium]